MRIGLHIGDDKKCNDGKVCRNALVIRRRKSLPYKTQFNGKEKTVKHLHSLTLIKTWGDEIDTFLLCVDKG